MKMEFNRHADEFKCESTIEFCVKNPSLPEGISDELWEHEWVTGEFTNEYADRCFKEIMRSGYRWLTDWSFAGRSNGWFVLMCDVDAAIEVRQSTIERIESIVERYFKNYGKELDKWYGNSTVENVSELPTAEDLENQGNPLDAYPVDESQTVANAGDAILYELNGRKYQVIIWNDRAVDHVTGSKEVSEVKDTEY